MGVRDGTGAPVETDLKRMAAAPVARLATIRPDGTPHVVPITFALHGSSLVTAVDAKPKRTTNLQRLRNLRANPAVSVVVDHYDADWTQLWWVRVDGIAQIVENPSGDDGIDALVAKYAQYRTAAPAGPLIAIRPTRWSSWTAADS